MGITIQSSGSTYLAKGNWDFEGEVTAANIAVDGLLRVSAVETGSTATNLTNYGISAVGSTAAKNKYVLDAPLPGVRKTIYTDLADSTRYPIVYGGGALFESGSTKLADALYVSLQGVGSAVDLIGVSTAKWLAVGEVGTVAYTTTT